MGYAATTIVVFGVPVTQAEADQLKNTLKDPSAHIFSEGTHFSVHDIAEPGFNHFFGVELGANGYGRSDNIAKLIQSPSPQKISQFQSDCLPHLTALNVSIQPEIHVVTCTM